ncbi:MAG: TetR/AcrR family transcriptional regulator [Chloroflexota bacterium]
MPKVNVEHEEARRQRIVEAAGRCFSRQGYDNTSIDDVCREADVSKGGLYTYFKSKEQLFAAFCRAEWLTAFRDLAEVIDAEATVLGKLTAYGDYAFRKLESDGPIGQQARMNLAVWHEAAHNEETRRLVVDGYDGWHQAVHGLLQEGQASGELNRTLDPDMLATVLIGLFDGLQVHQVLVGGRLDMGKVRQTILDLIRGGILAK